MPLRSCPELYSELSTGLAKMGQSGSCHKENLLVPFSGLVPLRSLMALGKGCLVNNLSMGGVSVWVWIISLPLFPHLKNDIIWSFLKMQCDATGSLTTQKLSCDREDGDRKWCPAPVCQRGCYLTRVFFSVFNFSTWELLQLLLTCDLLGSEAQRKCSQIPHGTSQSVVICLMKSSFRVVHSLTW